MSSTAPRTLGPYEVLALLGAGGMGEVYRAKDTRLGRDIALKILLGDVANDAGGQVRPVAWSADSSHIYYLEFLPTQKDVKLMSIGTVGGEPDAVWTVPVQETPRGAAFAISPDGDAAALLRQGTDGEYDVYISQPLDSPLKRYHDSQVASHDLFNGPKMQFSPDGKQILLIRAGDSNSEEAWLLPWPASSGKLRQVLKQLPREGGTTPFAWM